ncbi:MAG: DUF4838 domain-containing protein [Clostridia bacterium]|nr:DUF4838 domain-containing protein [Clostridia bacterium]
MYRIYKITSHPTVDFAAEELKKYLRMMMPEGGDIQIQYDADAKEGLRLGLMSDFDIDTSEAEDLELDDILHIDTDGENGIIAGSNPRSVLLSVYRYLRENGCRWLFPGVDGEIIPVCVVQAVKYHKMADCRYRGQCNEGAEFQQNMLDVIDFHPKIGMNVFMLEFDNPKAYYNSYYNSVYNRANRDPEPIDDDTVKQWKRQCECEIAKRGLQFHDMGHGWTAEPFGISSIKGWQKEDIEVPEETADMLAMVNGKRGLFAGTALNTQFCMSNTAARTIVAKYITNYAKMHQNVDYLHVWLADATHNHCECDACRKKTPSDWYVILLNEIDERLTAEGLNTRIVFICYTDTTWAPVVERLNNKKRFSFMLAAITRTYTTCVPEKLPEIELKPFELNKTPFPQTVEEYIHHAKEWKRAGDCPSMVYEYHFWLHQYRDPGAMKFSKLLHDDVKGYHANGFDGLIQDGSQRSYFPNGLNYYVYAATLFDTKVDYEDVKNDYFTHAYGKAWENVAAYLTEITEAFDPDYMMGKPGQNGFYSPENLPKLRKVKEITAKYAPIFEENRIMPHRAQTVSMRLLKRHMEFCNGLAEVLLLKAAGNDSEAKEAFVKFFSSFGKYEYELATYFDQYMCFASLERLVNKPKTFYEI